jgi:hypothetical protein
MSNVKAGKPVNIELHDRSAFLLEKLQDLHHQCTVERSHYYAGNCVREAIALIEDLLFIVKRIKP